MVVIVLVGLARSGKDTAADYIQRRFGFAKYTFSSVLADLLKEKKLNPTKEAMLELGTMLRRQEGMDAVAKRLDQKIKETDNVLLVGPRSIEEINYFQQKFPNLKIIKVVAGKNERFERRSDLDPQTEKGFYQRDQSDVEKKGMQKVLDAAQLQMNNFGSLEEFQSEVESVMQLVLAE